MPQPRIYFEDDSYSSSSDGDSFVVRKSTRMRTHSRPRPAKAVNLEVPTRGRRAASVGPSSRDVNIFLHNENRSPSRERSSSHHRVRPHMVVPGGLVDFDEQLEPLRHHHRPRSHSRSRYVDDEELRIERILAEKRQEAQRDEEHRRLEEKIQELRRDHEKEIRRREREIERREFERREVERRSERKEPRVSRRDVENELEMERLRLMQHELETERFIDDQLLLRRAQAKEREQAEKEQEKRIREKIEAEKAKEEAEEAARKEYEAKLKKQAIEDYHRAEAEKKQRAKMEKEKADKEFEQRARATLAKVGYSDEQITAILKGEEKPTTAIARATQRPTVIKVSRHHIAPETLDVFQIPWEWDPRDDEYIFIKRWISDDIQEDLFEHTRNLRQQQKLLTAPPAPQPQVGVRVRDQDKMYLVRPARKKSPRRTAWLW
ncbi:hypothetical protein AJ79_04491 [Helicocarpus griseus UAMH5409]|uniref:Uncharacterized protein n=1 Tax=Helicocarpus griseus UAMH5409 TaxID=1447875 RepID=A0A2B7XTX6_9EURO|nr:hypothetical protein AJ79_04491 [Helicocarpus griseus UAMH5409]